VPAADSKGCLAHFLFNMKRTEVPQTSIYILQRTLAPIPANSNFKKVRQMAILIRSGLLYLTEWAAHAYEDISRAFFSRAEKPSGDIRRLFHGTQD
jgi:hypothetical protein